jgi:hypothetical protein
MDERPSTPSDDVWLPHEPGRPADPAPSAGAGAPFAMPPAMTTAPLPAAPPPASRGRRLLAGAALATGLAVGGAGVAAAVTSGDLAGRGTGAGAPAAGGFLPGVGQSGEGAQGQPQPGQQGPEEFRGRGGWHHGPGGRGGFGGDLRGALHGELVVPQEDGTGTRTITVQSGTVTAVSPTSLSVRSSDGFDATYVVSSSTQLAGDTGGISAVKKDHQVTVVATKSGSTLTAIRVGDRTLRQQQRPDGDDRRGPQAPTPAPSASTSGSSA